MRRTIVALAGVLMTGGAAVMAQQSDPIRQRQALMKNNQEQARTLTGIARGQAPFDLMVVQTALRAIDQNAKQIPSLFPPGTHTGETNALPTIWERKIDFDAHAVKLAQDAEAALARVTNQGTLQTELLVIGQDCGECHERYRKRPTQ
jgi:cytochrome c556